MNADRHYAVASILFDYVKSLSLRHLRDPQSVHKVSREIVKALDGASSAWKMLFRTANLANLSN